MRFHVPAFLLVGMLLTANGAGQGVAVAPVAPTGGKINPPNTDFSAYEKKFPWVLSAAILQAQAASMEKAKLHENVYEAKVGAYTLPDLFTLADGRKVSTPGGWEGERRAELLEIFRREVYGISPPKPATLAFRLVASDPRALQGEATLKRVAISFQLRNETFQFHLSLFVPNRRSGPAPVFLLLNHRVAKNTDVTRQVRSEFWPAEYAVSRGYAIAAVDLDDEVDPDKPNATTGLRAFYRRLYSKPEELTWATLASWAWSGSRAVDYFETDPDIDLARIAVIGHSRGGKTALWAAAQDTRFALACVNCAGEGGPALSRRDFGETLGMITTNFPYWFTPTYARYADRISSLPIDQHELVALVAPRGYHGGDASLDLHSDPRGSWLSLVEATKVWALAGRARVWPDSMPLVNDVVMDGPLAYHLREGGHALTTFDWKLYFDHADLFFRRSPR